jgi:zeta-carotene desaturase
LLKATVIKEVNATFSPEPGVNRWRPGQEIGVKNLCLAGDWTRTGWPATMEGAVRSGYLAAEALLAGFGQRRTYLQPDPPPEGLAAIDVLACNLYAHSVCTRSRRIGVTLR